MKALPIGYDAINQAPPMKGLIIIAQLTITEASSVAIHGIKAYQKS